MARTFSVLGMSCDGCANSVTKAIATSARRPVPPAKQAMNF